LTENLKIAVSVSGLSKTYNNGLIALNDISLDIMEGEILALLGPNGAGKTTLISIICGIVNPTYGVVKVGGYNVIYQYRDARRLVGLVPQELSLESFETVFDTIKFSRGLFGKPRDNCYLERTLRQLSLWDKRNTPVLELSGGMKRRVLIAKALSHEPRVLFLDEPTAGVDVQLRKDMWKIVRCLRETGVTVILTTHYIEEAELIADRIGVIDKGKLLLLDDKSVLMKKMGKKELQIDLQVPIDVIPNSILKYNIKLTDDHESLIYTYEKNSDRLGISKLLGDLAAAGVILKDVSTRQTSLEEIFVDLVGEKK
jgi:ABC-2 type transport system ATP-binding protein